MDIKSGLLSFPSILWALRQTRVVDPSVATGDQLVSLVQAPAGVAGDDMFTSFSSDLAAGDVEQTDGSQKEVDRATESCSGSFSGFCRHYSTRNLGHFLKPL